MLGQAQVEPERIGQRLAQFAQQPRLAAALVARDGAQSRQDAQTLPFKQGHHIGGIDPLIPHGSDANSED